MHICILLCMKPLNVEVFFLIALKVPICPGHFFEIYLLFANIPHRTAVCWTGFYVLFHLAACCKQKSLYRAHTGIIQFPFCFRWAVLGYIGEHKAGFDVAESEQCTTDLQPWFQAVKQARFSADRNPCRDVNLWGGVTSTGKWHQCGWIHPRRWQEAGTTAFTSRSKCFLKT